MPFDATGIRRAIHNRRVTWQRHALERMTERGIARNDVLSALGEGRRIEDYPESIPFPSGLFLGFASDRPIHVVAAWKEQSETLVIITVYEPNSYYFEDDYVTRKKR